MIPGTYNHQFVAGDSYQVTVTLTEGGTPIDTQGYTWAAEIRDNYLPAGNLIESFGVQAIAGGVILTLTPTQTRDLGQYSRLVWDLQSDSGTIRTWLSGTVGPKPEVTND